MRSKGVAYPQERADVRWKIWSENGWNGSVDGEVLAVRFGAKKNDVLITGPGLC